MGVIGAVGVGITPPSPDPFRRGRVVSKRGTGMIKDIATGEITYFGTPVSEPQQVAQPEQPKLPNPYAMLEEETGRGEQEIESEFAANESAILQKPQNRLQTLESEFEIQDRALRNKFLKTPPEGKTAQDQLDAYHDALDQLKTQKQIAALRIEDKVQPERDQLSMQRQQALAELQKTTESKRIELDTIKRLGDTGKLDPDAVLHEQLQVMGLNISLAELRPPDPRSKLKELEYAIRVLEDRTDLTKLIMAGEIPGPEHAADLEQLAEYKRQHREEFGKLYQIDDTVIKRPKLSAANKALADNKGGTIGTMLRSRGTAARTPMFKQPAKQKVDPLGIR